MDIVISDRIYDRDVGYRIWMYGDIYMSVISVISVRIGHTRTHNHNSN